MNQNVIITGAGSGIGKATARHLAKMGFTLILLGRNQEKLEDTQRNLENKNQHSCFSCDIREANQIRNTLHESGIKSLYAVVINAGIGGENVYGTKDRWQEIIDINLTGSYNTAQECLPYLKKDNNFFKKILFMSSILARLGVAGYSAYCASKAGIHGLMRSLATELCEENILVNALCPGWVNTDMAHQGLEGMAQAMKISKEEAYKVAMSQIPLGKMSEPEEISQLVGFMLSEAQNSITGQIIDINNGALMS